MTELSARISCASCTEGRQKLRAFLAKLVVVPREHKQRYAKELTGYLAELAKEKSPTGFRAGGNRTVSFQPAMRHDFHV